MKKSDEVHTSLIPRLNRRVRSKRAYLFVLFVCALLGITSLWQPRKDETTGAVHPPPYASKAETELKRLALLGQNEKLPPRTRRLGEPLPGVALVFLTIRGVRHRTLWQRWFEDAYAWLEAEGLEKNHDDGGDGTKHRSNIIRAYVHHPYWLDPELKADSVPAVLRPGIVTESADCIWRMINPCLHAGLKAALDNFHSAEWFYTVSADAIPVKPFSEMYRSLQDDPRSRLEFVRMVFERNAPKIMNWVLLTRQMTSVLVERPDMWIHEFFHTTPEEHWQAGADEYAPYFPLLERFGDNFFAHQHPGAILFKYEARPLDSAVNTFACWGSCDPFGTVEGSAPHLFRLLRRTGFERIHTSATVTHARKFDINTTVLGCPAKRKTLRSPHTRQLSLDHMRHKTRGEVKPQRRNTAGRDRRKVTAEPTTWATAKYGPFYSNRECSLTDFVSWRLNLHSEAIEEEEHAPFTKSPIAYQGFLKVEEQHKALVAEEIFGVRPEIIARYNTSTTT